MISTHLTRGLRLSTRYRQGTFEGDACLLVYDEDDLDDSLVSHDVKVIFESRPNTAHIFIAAPFVTRDHARTAISIGGAVQRATPYLAGLSGTISLIEVQVGTQATNSINLTFTPMTWDNSAVAFGSDINLPSELRDGWLFDLFHQNDGLVIAPAGVHFKKGSKKHTDKFLRTANVLTSSAACSVLAMFALTILDTWQPRRIFVDTSPLISVALALLRVARVHSIWANDVPVRSFGSYGGLHMIGRLSSNDVILISASTSGALASELKSNGAKASSIVTAYYLASDKTIPCPEGVLCDLTTRPERTFGYSPALNYSPTECTFCRSGFLVADLEGDQFLLQKRQNKLIRILKVSQTHDAREAIDALVKQHLFSISLKADIDQPTSLSVNGDRLLQHEKIRKILTRQLRRFCPIPLNIIVRVGVSERALNSLFAEAGLESNVSGVASIDWTDLHSVSRIVRGGALVVFGCLENHSRARAINATLRGVIPEGTVTYLSCLTVADSPEQLSDLKTFLRYGEHGADTFTYQAAYELAYPFSISGESPWTAELNLLNDLSEDADAPDELLTRKTWLASTSSAYEQLFLSARSVELRIQNDFVFLDTTTNKEAISQADIFTTVSNLLSSARCENRGLTVKPPSTTSPLRWVQSVYGQILLSPSNFLNFNDAILKASFLRAASKSELLYLVDFESSEVMLEVFMTELASWQTGTGDALPEFLVSLATHRLQLDERHMHKIRTTLLAASLPPYLQRIATAI